MSLTHCPNCDHENSWRRVYAEMNFKHKCAWEITDCENCHRKMIVHRKGSSIYLAILQGILWMLFPIILIGGVALGMMSYITAIILVIIYHFVSFWGIIKFKNYSETKK